MGRNVILVLTKVDISGAARAEAWTDYFRKRYPHLRVVQVESYVGKASDNLQGRKLYEPHLPVTFREKLVEEIKAVHTEMLQPPDKVKANPKWLQQWKPSVKRDIDWVGALNARGSDVGTVVGETVKSTEMQERDAPSNNVQEPEFLTIGLIGRIRIQISQINLTTQTFRAAQCWKIIIVECPVWYKQSTSLKDTRKGWSLLHSPSNWLSI